MLLNSKSKWGAVSQSLHWVTAALIFFSLITGYLWWLRKYTHVGVSVISNHKTVGLLVLLLVIMRVFWRLIVALPKPHYSLSSLQQILIKMSHRLIIALMIIMPISGWMMSTAAGYKTNIFFTKVSMPFIEKNKSLVELTSIIHHYAGWLLLVMLVVHIFIACWHHFIHKDPVFLRMLPTGISRILRIRKKL